MTEISMETCLLDMPFEVLFEIFCALAKDKLIEISRVCSKFRHVAGDTRLWKDVAIKYGSRDESLFKIRAFEDLYSEPWPVKAINLSFTQIKPPVFPLNEQKIKVARLDLSTILAKEVTIAAILSKYQCTELTLDRNILKIGPEAFSKQTDLEVLSVSDTMNRYFNSKKSFMYTSKEIQRLLPPILRYFKNLKTLDLTYVSSFVSKSGMSSFVKNLPTSLEKLFLGFESPDDAFFKLLAERTPNLRELKVEAPLKLEYKSLLKFQSLEVLHLTRFGSVNNNFSDLFKYLAKFPALKIVNFKVHDIRIKSPEAILENFRMILQPDGIIIGLMRYPEWPLCSIDKYLIKSWDVTNWIYF